MAAVSALFILILVPACAGFFVFREGRFRAGEDGLQPGDPLIYRKDKVSIHTPGTRARNIWAAENGDHYFYEVDKFWAVSDVLEDGRLVAVTRTGKRHYLQPGDRNLRKPGLVERLRYRSRFPHLDLVA